MFAGKLTINSPKRAAQLRRAIEKLGPAYVKVAQAVSTRGDVLDLNYLREIERLQDRVPPFPTKAALPIMAEGQRPALLTYLSLAVLQDQFVVLHTSHWYFWLNSSCNCGLSTHAVAGSTLPGSQHVLLPARSLLTSLYLAYICFFIRSLPPTQGVRRRPCTFLFTGRPHLT